MAALEGDSSKAGETAPRPSDDPAGVPLGSSSAAEETEKRQDRDSHDEDTDFDDRLDDDDDDVPSPPPLAAAPSTSSSFFRLEPPSEEALAEASALKAAGNEAFGQGSFEEAVAAYQRALEKLGDEVEVEEEEEKAVENEEEEEEESGEKEKPPPSATTTAAAATSEEATELGATLHANLSASFLKLSRFPEARDSADAALRLLPFSAKRRETKKEEGEKETDGGGKGAPPLLLRSGSLQLTWSIAEHADRQ